MKAFLIVILSVLAHFYVLAQTNKGSIHIELLGKSVYLGAINVEFQYRENITFGLGTGFMSASTGRNISYNKGEGQYFDWVSTTPLYVLHRFGTEKYSLLASYGLTIQNNHELVLYKSSFPQYSYRPYFIPFICTGYEFRKNRLIFRIPCYLAWIGRSDWFFPLFPWVGISFGYQL